MFHNDIEVTKRRRHGALDNIICGYIPVWFFFLMPVNHPPKAIKNNDRNG